MVVQRRCNLLAIFSISPDALLYLYIVGLPELDRESNFEESEP
jgi:hypothetical protein